MNRIIKFRVWDTKGKIFTVCEDFIGDTLTSMDKVASQRKCVLMQFTGLLDKNGKEIYEGDIVRFAPFNSSCHGKAGFAHENGIVSCSRYGAWVINGNKSYLKEMPFDNSFTGNLLQFENEEIIGNIYENPELISDKNP